MTEHAQIVLVTGESGTGKSRSLKNIRNQDKWMYLNCEGIKDLPFNNNFKKAIIQDAMTVPAHMKTALSSDKCNGVIVDTLTFLMDMFATQYVLKSPDPRSAWATYKTFFVNNLMQTAVSNLAQAGKPVIILAHNQQIFDPENNIKVCKVPVQGSLKDKGVEASFTTVVSTKLMSVEDLIEGGYESELLNITEDEAELGFKHVFQTRKTKDTIHEKIKSPEDLFTRKQTFIDNDTQILLDHMDNYYKKQ